MINQRGFGAVGFLALMPFLVSILTVVAGTAYLFKADAHLKQECRTSILTSQHKVADKLRALMKLNSLADQLRSERSEAEMQLDEASMSGNPVALAAAQLYVAAVRIRQAALAVRQRDLIIEAQLLSLRAPLLAKHAVFGALAEESLANGVAPASSHSRLERFGQFHVIASPAGDPTPDYNPAPDFTVTQTVDVNIKVGVTGLLPEWLRPLIPGEDLEISSHCQATIEKKDDSWVETLNAVR